MYYSPCCGKKMDDAKKLSDVVGRYDHYSPTKYATSLEVWQCPNCKKCYAIGRMVKTSSFVKRGI